MSGRTTLLDRYRGTIEGGLRRALAGPSPLDAILRYHVGLADAEPPALGKLLRPSLVLFTAEELGATVESALPAAVALELVHGFSLIHDDIQDRDEIRRGRPAVWARWGIAEAINAGDMMHAIAVRSALDAAPDVARALLEATIEMIEGQSLDLSFEKRFVTADEYLDMVDRKTGALFRCALRSGGRIAGVDEEVQERLEDLGRTVGRAFQIQDDLLGIWGDGDILGKPTASDVRRRKKSFPVVLAHAKAGDEDRSKLERIYEDAEKSIEAVDVDWVVGLLDRLDVEGQGRETVRDYLLRACGIVDSLPLSADARGELKDLIEVLARRDK